MYMKVICVLTSPTYGKLTIDKVYDVIQETALWYEIIDDSGYQSFFVKDYFIKLAELRQKQIDSILF